MKYDDSDFFKAENLANSKRDLELNFPKCNELIDIIINNMKNGSPNYYHYLNIINIHIFLKIRKKNRLIIEYKNTNERGQNRKIKIFGAGFVENNKANCEIVFNQKFEELKEKLDIKHDDPKFRIILFENKTVKNMTELFNTCGNLVSIYDKSKWDTSKVTNMSKMFNECKSLKIFPKINGWNTNNVTSMENLFNGCTSLNKIKGLSNWNTNNVTSMKNLFNECTSLNEIEDLSNWNTNNVTSMKNLFNGCISLKEIKGLSNWNTNDVTSMINLFNECIS